MAARGSPKPLVGVRVSGGMPNKIRFYYEAMDGKRILTMGLL